MVESEFRQSLSPRGQGTQERADGGESVQILETVEFVGKERVATSEDFGMGDTDRSSSIRETGSRRSMASGRR